MMVYFYRYVFKRPRRFRADVVSAASPGSTQPRGNISTNQSTTHFTTSPTSPYPPAVRLCSLGSSCDFHSHPHTYGRSARHGRPPPVNIARPRRRWPGPQSDRRRDHGPKPPRAGSSGSNIVNNLATAWPRRDATGAGIGRRILSVSGGGVDADAARGRSRRWGDF